MSEFELQPQPLSMDEPNTDKVFKNVKEIKIGDGTFSVKDGVLKIGDVTVIDSQGLNSLENFRSDKITDIATFETSSTSYVDVTGGTMTPLVLTRNAKVLFYINIIGRNNNFEDDEASVGYSCKARIYDVESDATRAVIYFKGNLGFKYTFGTPDSYTSSITSVSYSKAIVEEVPTGTHTFKYQLEAVNGGTARSFDADIGYVVLGI